MTGDIIVKPGNIVDHGWSMSVTAGGFRYDVVVTNDYWHKMTHGDISPVDLVLLGFEYVRQVHRLDSLASTFHLDQLDSLIPDFDRQVRAMAHAEAAANPR